jgi:hypothetical protein
VEEPVEDQQEHGHGEDRDHRFHALPVAHERGEHRLRDDEGDDRGGERGPRAEEQRLSQAQLRADEAGVSAARMSTASRPSRTTMIAVLTTIAVAEVGPEPTADSDAESASSSALRDASTSAVVDFRRISCASPAWPSAPYQNRPSVRANSSGARPRRRCSGPNSKNAYASSRACSAFPYSPARVAVSDPARLPKIDRSV